MPRTTTGSRRTPFLRGLGFLVAAALGVFGVWMIVTGNDSKGVRIGAISGFWGLLIGTYAVFGSRVPSRSPDAAPVVAPPPPPPSRELDIRQISEIERSAVAAARREFGEELQLMLRREMQTGFALEVANLRTEVHALRNELVEKVGGQLRLERIETTRLIGSDLEAVQSELRKLRETAPAVDPLAAQVAVPIPVSTLHTDIHDAEIVIETATDPSAGDGRDGAAAVVAPPEPQPQVAHAVPLPPPAAPQVVTAVPRAAPEQHAEPAVQQAAKQGAPTHPDPAAGRSADPLAGLPRITPFTDFALDLPAPIGPGAESDHGRGRRHRADEGGSEVLARILEREHVSGAE